MKELCVPWDVVGRLERIQAERREELVTRHRMDVLCFDSAITLALSSGLTLDDLDEIQRERRYGDEGIVHRLLYRETVARKDANNGNRGGVG